jgi:hypothetical protein
MEQDSADQRDDERMRYAGEQREVAEQDERGAPLVYGRLLT